MCASFEGMAVKSMCRSLLYLKYCIGLHPVSSHSTLGSNCIQYSIADVYGEQSRKPPQGKGTFCSLTVGLRCSSSCAVKLDWNWIEVLKI